MNGLRIIVTALLCTLLLAPAAFAGEVRLSVAASLKDVMNELTGSYQKSHPAVRFVANYGASGTLAKQIEQGAPVDLFISANPKWMAFLQQQNLVDAGSIAVFAHNTLVVAGTAGTRIASMQDLAKLGRIAIGSPKSVPAGEYAMAAIMKAGIGSQLAGKLVMARDVRDCLMYAEEGEVDGAFVYRTDALLAKRAKVLFTVPPALYPRVTYPMGLTTVGAKNGDAAVFYRFLQGAAARQILGRYGFSLK